MQAGTRYSNFCDYSSPQNKQSLVRSDPEKYNFPRVAPARGGETFAFAKRPGPQTLEKKGP